MSDRLPSPLGPQTRAVGTVSSALNHFRPNGEKLLDVLSSQHWPCRSRLLFKGTRPPRKGGAAGPHPAAGPRLAGLGHKAASSRNSISCPHSVPLPASLLTLTLRRRKQVQREEGTWEGAGELVWNWSRYMNLPEFSWETVLPPMGSPLCLQARRRRWLLAPGRPMERASRVPTFTSS